MTVVSRPDAKDIRDNGVDGESLLEGPIDGGIDITARGGGQPGQCPANLGVNRPLKDQVHQLQIRVGDGTLRVVEADDFSQCVTRPLKPPYPIDPILIGVDPPSHPPPPPHSHD